MEERQDGRMDGRKDGRMSVVPEECLRLGHLLHSVWVHLDHAGVAGIQAPYAEGEGSQDDAK